MDRHVAKIAAEIDRLERVAAKRKMHEEMQKAEMAAAAIIREEKRAARAAELEDERIWRSIGRRLGFTNSRFTGLRMAALSAAIDRGEHRDTTE